MLRSKMDPTNIYVWLALLGSAIYIFTPFLFPKQDK